MNANKWLILFLFTFWGLFVAAVKVSNWRAGKRWSDGPSLIPVIPFIPVLAGVIGLLVNWAAPPWGTWCIVGLHIGMIAVPLMLAGLHMVLAGRREAEPGNK